ncbi:MAG: hypothetical protein RXO24_04540 [Acidilobus sp.]
MVKCPYCGYEGEFRVLRTWRFRFYNVSRMECPRCHGVFNYYQGVSPKGKRSEFVIRVRPRPKAKASQS